MICKHSGKSGDLIYSLYAVKNLTSSLEEKATLFVIDKRITPCFFSKLRRLLLIQSYIEEVKYVNEDRGKQVKGINLDLWRKIRRLNKFKLWVAGADGCPRQVRHNQHIAQTHIEIVNKVYGFNLPQFNGEPWLHNVESSRKGKYIVVQRSAGFHNKYFNYSKHIPKGYQLLFLGTRKEFKDFDNEYPNLSLIHLGTALDFLKVASLIRGSKFFIGNQSVCSAIAQGLGHPQVQEVSELVPNCIPKVIYKK